MASFPMTIVESGGFPVTVDNLPNLSTVSYKDVTSTSNTTVGQFLQSNGTSITTLAGFNITEIDVTNVKGVRVYGYFSTAICALCFKDSGGNILDTISVSPDSGYYSFERDVPVGAVKAITSYSTSSSRAYKQETYVPTYESTYKDVTGTSTTTVGKYLQVNGVSETTLTGFNITAINVSDAKSVRVYGFYSNVVCALVFKDLTGNLIGSPIIASGSGYTFYERDVPIGAVTAYTSYSTSSNRAYKQEISFISNASGSNILDTTGVLKWNGLNKLRRINMILLFGQSLSIGAAALPVITTSQKYKVGLMFNGGVRASQKTASFFTSFQSLFENATSVNGETPASGIAEGLVEEIQRLTGLGVNSDFWDTHQFLFVSCGEGSKKISDLTTDYYAGFLAAVQGAKNICNTLGYTLYVPAWVWIQGETDQKDENTNYTTYKTQLTNLATQIDTDVKAITGQSEQIKCVCYQTASQNIVSTTKIPSYTNTAMDIPTAQMELVRDNPYFIASSPVYSIDHSWVEPIHLSPSGSKTLGFHCGIALGNYIALDYQKKGVTPASYSVTGNQLDIIYNVQAPPLRFNSDFVKSVPNYGFTLLNNSNVNTIVSASVFDNTVSLYCNQTPSGSKLFYGFNGTSMFDGRVQGSRGNLVDSQYARIAIQNKEYVLSNYAYTFSKIIGNLSGSI